MCVCRSAYFSFCLKQPVFIFQLEHSYLLSTTRKIPSFLWKDTHRLKGRTTGDTRRVLAGLISPSQMTTWL